MAGHSENISRSELWGGDGSPFRISYGKQWMWMFLVSDALTFGGLLTAYGFARHQAADWPIGEETFNAMPFLGNGYPLLYVALMTFILIVSSVTMVLAVEAAHRLDKKGVVKWLLTYCCRGLIFCGFSSLGVVSFYSRDSLWFHINFRGLGCVGIRWK